MEIIIKVVQLLLSLSILVIFHEFGHFIAARIFKTRFHSLNLKRVKPNMALAGSRWEDMLKFPE
jgi:membrane-associated protease RseP (regulator of RpoE activity)